VTPSEGSKDSGPTVEVRDLVKSYDDVRAVDGISFEVRAGTVFAFLGPNGAGKTTTVEILEGIRPRGSGQVRVLGRDPWTDRDQLLRRVGVIPQDFSFFDKITPVEGIEFYASLFDRPVDALGLLRRVELEEKAHAYFEKLSGGQKQKLGLALALVNRPEVLFLDEPTTGLDPQARRTVWEVIRSLRAEGRTIFLTTHYLEEAQTLADQVAIIDHGRIIAQGTPQAIIARYGRSERLRIEAPESVAAFLRTRWKGAVDYQDGRVLVEIDGKEGLLQALGIVAASGLPWVGVETVHDTLEDVFVRLVGRMDDGRLAEPAQSPPAAGGR
jgi:ABC-2 type transport system ATP-binding protein